MKQLFNIKNYRKHNGFTLIEVIIVVAILAALTASAIYTISPGDKISSAEETGLKQILVSRVPTELTQYRLKNGNLSGFRFTNDNIAFMGTWPGVRRTNKLKFNASANKLVLEMETTFNSSNLRRILTAMNNVSATVASGALKVEYNF